LAFARLRDSEVVAKLFGDLGQRFKARAGGYTRILHMLPRAGDAAPMALMQLVDGPVVAAKTAPAEASGKARASRSSRSKATLGEDEPKSAAQPKTRPRRKKAAAA